MRFFDRALVRKERLKQALGSREALAFLFRYKYGGRFVSEDTHIVIEGAPSSGNSFAVTCFALVQKRTINIAHHLHIPLQVMLAVKNNIPCVVLIREPLDAVVSFVSRSGRLRPNESHTAQLIWQWLRYWEIFYSTVKPYLKDCLLCPFDDLKLRYPRVIEAVNVRYGTEFVIPTNHHVNQALRSLDERVRPTARREGLKRDMKLFAERETSLIEKIKRCRNIYFEILGAMVREF